MTLRNDSGARHPLFHAMVLMGGSLALNCGGSARHDAPASGGNQATGGTGAGGVQSKGGSASGGELIIGTGGAVTSVDPGPFDCPPEQWDCSAKPPSCNGSRYTLPDSCACDPKRPQVAADCVDSDWVCRYAEYDSQGRPFTTPVSFECTCAQRQANCSATCESVYDYPSRCKSSQPDPGSNAVLCDCAVIVLR